MDARGTASIHGSRNGPNHDGDPPLDLRLTIKNERAFRRSIRDVLAWDFYRAIPGHGEIIETGGKRAVIDGVEWIL